METDIYAQALWVSGLIGSIAFAISGFMAGARKGLDIMGVFILAFLTANGGGILRDVLTGAAPLVMKSAAPFWIAAGTVLACWIARLQKYRGIERNWLFIASDAIGLTAFAITGALTGVSLGLHFFAVLTLSLLTAVGGGIIRDLLVKEVPEVLHGGFYGSVALLAGCAVFALHEAVLASPVAITVTFCGGVALRLVAYKYAWRLPKITSP
ncbi:MAG TPA: trimeric intracellular cation channel family protein [Patescibacteria group bacterium]|nr:trimeric intracellular cation channel family protein [Patescibacteria group bacterium]